jgi:hypothetical protein
VGTTITGIYLETHRKTIRPVLKMAFYAIPTDKLRSIKHHYLIRKVPIWTFKVNHNIPFKVFI